MSLESSQSVSTAASKKLSAFYYIFVLLMRPCLFHYHFHHTYSEIFLLSRAARLIADATSEDKLRSGLYILRPELNTSALEQIFLIYWPEQDTWNDSAPPAIGRNRTTFIRCVYFRCILSLCFNVHSRYLTKLCDQVVALMSPEHAQPIMWNEHDEANDRALHSNVSSARIISCVVDRTTDQEESINVRRGFRVSVWRLPASKY